jgi:hypothetical protein
MSSPIRNILLVTLIPLTLPQSASAAPAGTRGASPQINLPPSQSGQG